MKQMLQKQQAELQELKGGTGEGGASSPSPTPTSSAGVHVNTPQSTPQRDAGWASAGQMSDGFGDDEDEYGGRGRHGGMGGRQGGDLEYGGRGGHGGMGGG